MLGGKKKYYTTREQRPPAAVKQAAFPLPQLSAASAGTSQPAQPAAPRPSRPHPTRRARSPASPAQTHPSGGQPPPTAPHSQPVSFLISSISSSRSSVDAREPIATTKRQQRDVSSPQPEPDAALSGAEESGGGTPLMAPLPARPRRPPLAAWRPRARALRTRRQVDVSEVSRGGLPLPACCARGSARCRLRVVSSPRDWAWAVEVPPPHAISGSRRRCCLALYRCELRLLWLLAFSAWRPPWTRASSSP